MIQRIQSVFLFLIVVAMVSLLFLPMWSKMNPADNLEYVLTAYRLGPPADVATDANSRSTVFIAILAALAGAIALYEIFQYKSRLNQMKLGMLNSLVMAALMGCIFYFSTYVGEDLIKTNAEGDFMAGFYLPAVGLLCNVLANRFIKRDEDLVRSMDRLR